MRIQFLFKVTFILKEKTDNKFVYEYFPEGDFSKKAGIIIVDTASESVWVEKVAEEDFECHTTADELNDKIAASLPSTELYRKDFASPIWAPTLTGFMILMTLIIIVVIFIRGIIWIILRLSLLFV